MRLILLFIGLSIAFLIGWVVFGEDIEHVWNLERMVESFEQARAWAWLLGIALLVADLLLPIPGTVVMSALGAVYGVWIGGLFAAVGSMLAGTLGYGVGRFFKEKFTRKWLGEKDFEKGKKVFGKHGAVVIAMSRALPILPEVLSCMAGLLHMPFPKFIVALACGAFPIGFLFAWVGAIGRENPAWGIWFSLGLPALLWLIAKAFIKK